MCKTEGRQKYYQANPKCPIYDELRGIAVKTAGLAEEIPAVALAPMQADITTAFIYGSPSRREQPRPAAMLTSYGCGRYGRDESSQGCKPSGKVNWARAVNYRLL